MKTVLDFKSMKNNASKISMITCYDHWSARLIESSDIDCILVGDSVAMIMHGHDSTIPAEIDIMALHVSAVRKGAPSKFIVGDMPFLSFRKGLVHAMESVEMLIKAGANCIKLEGIEGNEEIVEHIVKSGVPVMGHLGLTPQAVNSFGGFKVQGKEDNAAEWLIAQARELEKRGAFALVLECIPAHVAKKVTDAISIPTIGIGAGQDVDGQVLVLQDMLGMDNGFSPKFLKKYLNGAELITNALNLYNEEVKGKSFPTDKESY